MTRSKREVFSRIRGTIHALLAGMDALKVKEGKEPQSVQSGLEQTTKHKTIGVFASQVGRTGDTGFLAGLNAAAEEHHVNLVYFIGGRLAPIVPADQSQLSFGLYDLARPGQLLDGLIFTGDVAYGVSPQDLKTVSDVYGSIPIVTQSVELEGASMFIPDNVEGMRAAVRHLIEEHGYTRIAFLRGIPGQIDAERRYQAYQDELKAHGLRLDENLVVAGDYSPESGRAAVRILLDERQVRFQALVAANDIMAIGALEALQQRGVRVPEEAAVTGFDDLREAQATGVSLTTVRQSFFTAGKRALEALLKRIDGETTTPVTVTPTRLIIRWSCGCMPENVREAVVAPRDVAKTGRQEDQREVALRALLHSAGVTEQDPALLQFREAFGRAWDGFLLTLSSKSSSDDFLKTINSMIDRMQRHGLAPAVWHSVISMMRRYALGGITSQTSMLQAEGLFQQARLLAGELSQRSQAYRRLILEQQEHLLNEFSFSMAPAMSMDEMGAAIVRHFPDLGIERLYVMFYSDQGAPPESYNLLFQYEAAQFELPQKRLASSPGELVPLEKIPADHRHTAVVMPLSLAGHSFGFMWVEMGPRDWEIYVRLRDLLSSALLRVMLVQQKEQAQREVERLLAEARDRSAALAIAREFAERTAAENARLFSSEQTRREAQEALNKSARQLSSLGTVTDVPHQIITQLSLLIPHDRSAIFNEDMNGSPSLIAHSGFPADTPVETLTYTLRGTNVYHLLAKQSEPLVIGDIRTMQSWKQPDWAPEDRSWLGVPLYSRNKVMGMLTLTRSSPAAFNQDDVLLANTFAIQASIALENARLYDDLNRFNQMMERMVESRIDELNSAYQTLEKLDKNKSDYIQVAAHELRTPLGVIKGYLGIFKSRPAVQENPTLHQVTEGVIQGADRLHQIVNSMLDVARLENEVLAPHLESVTLGPVLRLVWKEYAEDLEERQIKLELDPAINTTPPLLADSELLKKALDHILVNAIKFTPDGGSIFINARPVQVHGHGDYCEIRIRDTGIGIDPANHKIVFEKLYQLGKVELHSSGRTRFKGGGPGLGLAIAAGIVKSHRGKIWVESPGYDEKKLPGSTFIIQIPLAPPV